MSLSLSLTPEMAEALRNAKGRSTETTVSSSSNLVKLTRKSDTAKAKSLRIYDDETSSSEKAGAASVSDESCLDESTKFSTSTDVPDAWDDPDAVIALPDKSDFQASGTENKSSSSSFASLPRNLEDVDDFLAPARLPKAPAHTDTPLKASVSTELDEPVILVNLDQLCGFRVQPEQAAEFAQQLQKDLLGQEASSPTGDTNEEPANGEAPTTAAATATAGSLRGGARFLARSSELFEIGAAIHATRRKGPRFTDEFVAAAAAARAANPPKTSSKSKGNSSDATLVASSATIGSNNSAVSGGTSPNNNSGEDALWVSVRYPAVLPDSSSQGSSSKEDIAVPTADLWQQLHQNKSTEVDDKDSSSNSSSGDGFFGTAVLRLRELVRSCSMPLPWKCAMDAEVCSLAARVASSMRLARAEKWRRQRPARVHQLDEVRDLLLAQKEKFERQLDAASFQRDALLDDKNSGTFAGFAALASEDEEEGDDSSSGGRKKKAVKAKAEEQEEEPAPVRAAGETEASAAALELEVAQCRSMVFELEARLDTVDELYGLLLDEEEEEEEEEEGSENDDDDDDNSDNEDEDVDDDATTSFPRGMGLNSASAAAVAANEADADTPPPAPVTAAAGATSSNSSSSGLPSAPLPGAGRAQRSLRPGASVAAKRGAAGGGGGGGGAVEDAAATDGGNAANDDDESAAAAAALRAENAAVLRAAAVAQAKRQLEAEQAETAAAAHADARAAAAQAEALGARVSGALDMPLPSLRLDLVDAICAMALGRLPRRPTVTQAAHFAHLAWLHADVRQVWEAEFSALAEETRNWELAVPVAPPNLLNSSTN